ncbi:MAG: carbohydrate binding domain-containing protein [Trueperaceae bacterium]
MRSIKVVFIFVCLLLGGFLFAACAPSTSPTPGDEPSKPAEPSTPENPEEGEGEEEQPTEPTDPAEPTEPDNSPTEGNLIQNGDFASSIDNWDFFQKPKTGFAKNEYDAQYKRNFVYIDQKDLPNASDIAIFQEGLTLKKGLTYTLNFEMATANQTAANITVQLKGSSVYGSQDFALEVGNNAPQKQTMSFTMEGETDTAVKLEFQLAGNPEASNFYLDNVELTEAQ